MNGGKKNGLDRGLTCISPLRASGKFDNEVLSSSAASTAILSEVGVLYVIFWADGGMPVTVSILVLNWAMLQDGVIRRSDDE